MSQLQRHVGIVVMVLLVLGSGVFLPSAAAGGAGVGDPLDDPTETETETEPEPEPSQTETEPEPSPTPSPTKEPLKLTYDKCNRIWRGEEEPPEEPAICDGDEGSEPLQAWVSSLDRLQAEVDDLLACGSPERCLVVPVDADDLRFPPDGIDEEPDRGDVFLDPPIPPDECESDCEETLIASVDGRYQYEGISTFQPKEQFRGTGWGIDPWLWRDGIRNAWQPWTLPGGSGGWSSYIAGPSCHSVRALATRYFFTGKNHYDVVTGNGGTVRGDVAAFPGFQTSAAVWWCWDSQPSRSIIASNFGLPHQIEWHRLGFVTPLIASPTWQEVLPPVRTYRPRNPAGCTNLYVPTCLNREEYEAQFTSLFTYPGKLVFNSNVMVQPGPPGLESIFGKVDPQLPLTVDLGPQTIGTTIRIVVNSRGGYEVTMLTP